MPIQNTVNIVCACMSYREILLDEPMDGSSSRLVSALTEHHMRWSVGLFTDCTLQESLHFIQCSTDELQQSFEHMLTFANQNVVNNNCSCYNVSNFTVPFAPVIYAEIQSTLLSNSAIAVYICIAESRLSFSKLQ